MPRPIKMRRICGCRHAGVHTGAVAIHLSAAEFEALRLSDLEEIPQSSAAERMAVSRGTFQRLLYAGHRKTAFALAANRPLTVDAPDSAVETVQSGCANSDRCRYCYRKLSYTTLHSTGENIMRIAVTSENGQVFQHFGHTPEFSIFEIEDQRIAGMKTESTGDSGHEELVRFLADRQVEILLAGGIGAGAQNALAEANIKLVGGVSGDVVEAVGNYLKGTLHPRCDFQCKGHQHGPTSHDCAHHCHGGHHE